MDNLKNATDEYDLMVITIRNYLDTEGDPDGHREIIEPDELAQAIEDAFPETYTYDSRMRVAADFIAECEKRARQSEIEWRHDETLRSDA